MQRCRKRKVIPFLHLFVCLMIAIGTTGCDPVDRAIDMVDRAIEQLTQESASWQFIVQRLAEEFPEGVRSTIRNEVQLLAARTITHSAHEFVCPVDFYRDSMIYELRRVRAMLLDEPAISPLPPRVCTITPNVVNLNDDSNEHIDINGFNLDTAPVSVQLVSLATNQLVQVPEVYYNHTTHYQHVLLIEQLRPILEEQAIVQINVTWEGILTRDIGVTPRQSRDMPQLCQITHPVQFMPVRLVQGDRDFDTDDDNWLSYRVGAETKLERNAVWLRLYMYAHEDDPDNTTVDEWGPWQQICAPSDPMHQQLVGYDAGAATSSYAEGVVNNDGHEVAKHHPTSGPIAEFTIQADHDGDDVGYYTQVEARLRYIQLSVRETNTMAGIEWGIDRPGNDYMDFTPEQPNVRICRDRCDQDPRCQAWTYVRPTERNPRPHCWLKNAVSPAVLNEDTASGER